MNDGSEPASRVCCGRWSTQSRQPSNAWRFLPFSRPACPLGAGTVSLQGGRSIRPNNVRSSSATPRKATPQKPRAPSAPDDDWSHRAAGARATARVATRAGRLAGARGARAASRLALSGARRHWGSAAVSFSPRVDGVAMCGWGVSANPPPSRNGCERSRGTARLGGRRPLSRRAVFAVMPRATRWSPLPSSRIIPSSFPRCIRVRALHSRAPSSSNTVVRCSVTFFRARCARDRSFSHQDRDRILTGLRIDGQHGGAAAARWAPAGFAIRPRRTPARP